MTIILHSMNILYKMHIKYLHKVLECVHIKIKRTSFRPILPTTVLKVLTIHKLALRTFALYPAKFCSKIRTMVLLT